jgi:hypothetical protein
LRESVGIVAVLALVAPASGLSAETLDAQPSQDVAALSRIAAAGGVDITVLGQPSPAGLAEVSESSDPSTALAFLRSRKFDRVEVYGGEGQLQKLVSVVRSAGEGGAPRPGSRSRTTARAGQSNPSLAEALAVARDRDATRADRQRAIAALSRSGSEAAVNGLREIIAGDDDEALKRLAISALGGFAGGSASDAAQSLIGELRDLGIGDPVELAGAQAAHDVSPLIGEFLEIGDSSLRKRFMHAVARSGSGPDFVQFILTALGDDSVTIRNAAVIQSMRSEDLVNSALITQALQEAISDPMRRVRAAAAKALYYRKNRSVIDTTTQQREAPIPRVDDDPIIPGT